MRVVVINRGKSLGQLTPEIMKGLEAGLDIAAEGVKADFDATVETWLEKPVFTIQKSPTSRVISTTNQLYEWVNDGTTPHPITPVRARFLRFTDDSVPKTQPNVLGSGSGSPGSNVVYRKFVRRNFVHARNFEEAIGEKWDEKVDDIVQAELDKVQP